MQTTELALETIRVCLRTRRGTAYARRYTLRASGPPFRIHAPRISLRSSLLNRPQLRRRCDPERHAPARRQF